MEQASKLAPERLDVHFELGRILFDAREYPDAEEQASIVLKGKPDDAKAQELMAASLLGEGKTEDAWTAFAKLVEISPNDASARVNLAIVQMDQKQYSEAEANFRKAIELDPKGDTGLSRFGKHLLGETTKERRLNSCFSRVSRKNPDRYILVHCLGRRSLRPAKDCRCRRAFKRAPGPGRKVY